MRSLVFAALILLTAWKCCSAHSCGHDHGEHHHHSQSHSPAHDHGEHHPQSHFHSPAQAAPDHQHLHSKLLPEEAAEEEDLRLYGFGSGHSDHDNGLTTAELWTYAMGSSLLVSLASLICLTILPLIVSKGKPSRSMVNVLAAFGGGAMMGDAFLHQLPHAFGKPGQQSHSHGHSHSHGDHDHEAHGHTIEELSIGLSVLAGIILFFIVEKIVRYVEEHGFQSGHHHHHHHHHNKKNDDAVPDDTDGTDSDKPRTQTEEKTDEKTDEKKVEEKNQETENLINPQPSKLVLGYLNLFSDGVHNFTDGMALGAAFLVHGTAGGLSRTFFLLAHELPQEVGDFGILVGSGFTVFKALAFNFLSALAALAGTALALLLGVDPGQSSIIEGFTAGGFLYISLAGVLPELHQQGSSLKNTLTQLTALCLGIAVAVAISLAE